MGLSHLRTDPARIRTHIKRAVAVTSVTDSLKLGRLPVRPTSVAPIKGINNNSISVMSVFIR